MYSAPDRVVSDGNIGSGDGGPPGEPSSEIRRVCVLIAVILGVAALRLSYPIAMPLAFALIVVAAAWPLKPWLDKALPSWAGYFITVIVLLLVLTGFAAAVYFSTAQATRAIVANWAALEGAYDAAAAWAARHGVPLDGVGDRRALAAVQSLVSDAYTLVTYLGFICVLVILGLPEVPAMRRKLRAEFGASVRREILDTIDTIAEKVRKYLSVTMVTSILTGAASALWSYMIGLDLALTWGVLNFVLNFIPIVGNLIGILPPTLYALVQFGGWAMPLVVFAGFAFMQILISNFVYPLLQGRSLSLSPVGIVVALAFWGWLWGIAGALIAVPLTAAIVIVCEHFEGTRWVARILSKG